MFACLYIPDFSVQAVLRTEPEHSSVTFDQTPVAVLDGPATIQRVIALNPAARCAGAEIGMTRLQLEACERIVIRKRSPALEKSARAALLDCAHSFSPRVEAVEDGTAVADLAGTEKLFGPSKKFASAIATRTAEFGFAANIGIAANPDTAVHVARGYSGTTIVAPGEEAQRLAPLPIDVLVISPEMMEILDAWGIRNCQALANLPSIPLVERLGQEGLKLKKFARGEVRRTLVPVEPPHEFVESFEFEDPVESLEGISFILNRLLQQLCSRLAVRSLATNELRLTLSLDVRQVNSEKRGEFYERVWKLPIATQNPKTLFKLIHLDLETTTHSAPIKAITLQAEPTKIRFAQNGLFVPNGPEPEGLEITLQRIRGLVGDTDENGIGRVGSPKILDSHKPDSFEMLPFSVERKNTANIPKKHCIVFRIFRPMLPAKVELTDETPAVVLFKRKKLNVLAASGPWRSSGQWWSVSTAWVRDEWDVALNTKEGIGFYRIFFDVIQKQWFVEGMFD
jgi:protein ImuB